jgi:hypothetical protein
MHTPKEKNYGANSLIKRIGVLLQGKYDSEVAQSMASPASLMNSQLQTLLLCELLEEIRKLNSVMIDELPKGQVLVKETTGAKNFEKDLNH